MAGKAKKVASIEADVKAHMDSASAQTNPGVIDTAMFEVLLVIARGIDELKAEVKGS